VIPNYLIFGHKIISRSVYCIFWLITLMSPVSALLHRIKNVSYYLHVFQKIWIRRWHSMLILCL